MSADKYGMKRSQGGRAAAVSFVLVITFLLLLFILHFLEPEFNGSGQLISLYELGAFGVLMSLAFFCVGVSALFLVVALWKDVENRRGRVGLCWLALIGIAFIGAGIFAPDRGTGLASSAPMSLAGTLHTISGLFVIFTAPVAFTVVGSSLRRTQQWSFIASRLRWTAVLAWIGLASFFVSLIIYTNNQQSATATLVSITNRFMVVTYCLWIMIVGWQKKKTAKAA